MNGIYFSIFCFIFSFLSSFNQSSHLVFLHFSLCSPTFYSIPFLSFFVHCYVTDPFLFLLYVFYPLLFYITSSTFSFKVCIYVYRKPEQFQDFIPSNLEVMLLALSEHGVTQRLALKREFYSNFRVLYVKIC